MSLHKILSDIQKKLVAPKNQQGHNYNFRSCEDILEALKPHLGDCAVTLNDEIALVGERYYIKSTAFFTDGDEAITANGWAREPEKSRTGMDESQITGSASSYARKYALSALFAIDDVTDPDALKHRGILAKLSDPEINEKAVRETAAAVTELMEKDDAAGAYQLYDELNRLEQSLILTAPKNFTDANIKPILTTAEVKWFKASANNQVAINKQLAEQENTITRGKK